MRDAETETATEAPQAEKQTAAKRTVEQWAESKGMLPERVKRKGFVGNRPAVVTSPNPKHGEFRQAKALRAWPTGAEVTEQEFDEAVAEAGSLGLR